MGKRRRYKNIPSKIHYTAKLTTKRDVAKDNRLVDIEWLQTSHDSVACPLFFRMNLGKDSHVRQSKTQKPISLFFTSISFLLIFPASQKTIRTSSMM